MIEPAYFITGTDTDVGKTWVTLALMELLKIKGCRVAGMKPVAAGCKKRQEQWQNEDALLIQKHASIELPYSLVNPYAFEMPVSPHLAAQGASVDVDLLNNVFTKIKQQVDVVLVEGAGGWLSPLSEELSNAGLAQLLDLPVIFVVGLKLGCINHALLTWQALHNQKCAGWVAVELEQNMDFCQENVEYLQKRIDAPLLGVLPFDQDADFERLSKALRIK